MRGILYNCTTSGLGNRIRGFVGYRALSRALDLPFYCHWKANWACEATFAELFDPSAFTFVSAAEAAAMTERGEVEVYDRNLEAEKVWGEFGRHRVQHRYMAQWLQVCRHELRPQAELLGVVNAFAAKHKLCQLPGLHVRATDNLEHYDEWLKKHPTIMREHFSKEEGFLRYAEDQLVNGGAPAVFLATDSAAVQEAFSNRFGDRVVFWDKSFRPTAAEEAKTVAKPRRVDRYRPGSIQEAVVEMWLLGRCKHVVGTYFSSFSKQAAWLGGATYFEMCGVEPCEWQVGMREQPWQ